MIAAKELQGVIQDNIALLCTIGERNEHHCEGHNAQYRITCTNVYDDATGQNTIHIHARRSDYLDFYEGIKRNLWG